MKKILFIIFTITFLLFAGRLYAQTVTNSAGNTANKYNITFPVAELGNCTDVASCKTYCDDPNHLQACIDFAKKKGFYKQPQTQSQDILDAAKTELGCDSADSCKAFCQDSANQAKCSAFAKGHNISTPQVKDPSNNQTLQQAQAELGCNSVDSCRAFCSQSQNQQKCSDFAHKAGLKGGVQKVGPGGCTSEDSCKAFCSDPANFQTCQQFTQQIASTSASGQKPQFTGPGGCTTEDSCRVYCQQNPTICNRLQSGLPPQQSVLPSVYPSYSPSVYPSVYISPIALPTASQDAYKPYCEKNGCSWTGASCICPKVSPNINTVPTYAISPRPTYPYYPSPTIQTNTSSGSSQVRGIMTVRSLFQAILDFFHFSR